MKIETWLKAKKVGLDVKIKHSNNMINRIDNGENIPYGRDYSGDEFYFEAQQDLIKEILDKINKGVIEVTK